GQFSNSYWCLGACPILTQSSRILGFCPAVPTHLPKAGISWSAVQLDFGLLPSSADALAQSRYFLVGCPAGFWAFFEKYFMVGCPAGFWPFFEQCLRTCPKHVFLGRLSSRILGFCPAVPTLLPKAGISWSAV